GMVKQIEVEVPTPEDGGTQQLSGLQLATHSDTEVRLGRLLLKRAEKELPSGGAPWRDLLIEAIRKTGAEVDLDNPRHVHALSELYAVLRALAPVHVERLIFPGAPIQRPPIGVGRPFADLVGVLDEPSDEGERTAAELRTRLTVEVRTSLGAPSDALRLAAWF